MDFHGVANTIRAYFNAQWTAAGRTEPIAPDNNPSYSPPVDANGKPLPWVRQIIEPALNEQETMGPSTGKYLCEGYHIIQIFYPPDKGTGAVFDMADDVVSILRSQNLSGVWMDAPTPVRIGVVDEGLYYQMNVETLWRHFAS